MLVTATQKQCTRYNLSNGEIESQVKWDSSYGSLETVQGVDFANGGQKIIGRCSGDHTTWVSMNVNDGSIDWRLPIYSSLGGDSWGVGYRLFRRAGNEPPRIALNNSRSQTVLQTIGTGKRSPDPIVTSVSQKEAGSLEDRRYIRNLPAARNVETSIDRVVASLVSTIFGLGIFVVPFLYLRKLFKRQFSIPFFLCRLPCRPDCDGDTKFVDTKDVVHCFQPLVKPYVRFAGDNIDRSPVYSRSSYASATLAGSNVGGVVFDCCNLLFRGATNRLCMDQNPLNPIQR